MDQPDLAYTPSSPLLTLEDLLNRPDQELEWYAPDWIPVGAKTILCAPPKYGKTILLFHLLKAITTGGEFCKQPCTRAKVLYLTEQTEFEFKRQVKEIPGLLGNPDIHVLLAENVPMELRTWPLTLTWCDLMMNEIGAKILVVDTFLSYAKLPMDGENDSATIQNTLNDMNFLFKTQDRSIVLCHHMRKKSDDPRSKYNPMALESVRGSSAFGGGAGHVILMDAPNGTERTERSFGFIGRYNNGTEIDLTLVDQQYRLSRVRKSSR